MKLLHKLVNEHCENMRPGSSIEYTNEFKEAWEIRVSYEAGFYAARELLAQSFDKLHEKAGSNYPIDWKKSAETCRKLGELGE